MKRKPNTNLLQSFTKAVIVAENGMTAEHVLVIVPRRTSKTVGAVIHYIAVSQAATSCPDLRERETR